jgi:anti-sigma B factor antagonist
MMPYTQSGMITESKSRRIEPDITVVEISGRLALGNLLGSIENSIKNLIQEGARKLVIDLSRLEYIDSAGIGVLVASSGLMEENGGQLRISGVRGMVAKSFGVVHMDRIVALDSDLESSCNKLSAGSAAG